VFERSFKDFEFIKFTASSLLIISREGCKWESWTYLLLCSKKMWVK
jgi:hypothetical protein